MAAGQDTSSWPTGPLALVFTDVERSTELWQIDEGACEGALAEHDRLTRAALAAHGGVEVKHTGDGFFLVFREAGAAASFALELQQAMTAHPWPAELGELKVRIGLHFGRARLYGSDYRGPAVNLTARICNACSGGQILTSGAMADRLFPIPGFADRVQYLGSYGLPGLSEPLDIYELRLEASMGFDFRPLSEDSGAPAEPRETVDLGPPATADNFTREDEKRWQRIKVALRQADNATAVAELRELAERRPGDVRVLTTLGVAYAIEQQFHEAEKCLETAVELEPLHASAWFNLARVYGKLGRRDKIGPALAMALKADPHHPKARAVAAKYGVVIPE